MKCIFLTTLLGWDWRAAHPGPAPDRTGAGGGLYLLSQAQNEPARVRQAEIGAEALRRALRVFRLRLGGLRLR